MRIAEVIPELLDDELAAALAGVSRRTWLMLVSKGDAPKPVELPVKRMTRWRRGDVLKWIAELPTRN
jgi:predicted DNA-binding transcriptional regulator AlpA